MNNSRHAHQLESDFAESDLWVLVDNKLTMCQQHTLPNNIMDCIKNSISIRLRGG